VQIEKNIPIPPAVKRGSRSKEPSRWIVLADKMQAGDSVTVSSLKAAKALYGAAYRLNKGAVIRRLEEGLYRVWCV
jgi:hypothetical protein